MRDTKMIRIVSRGYVMTSRGRVITPIMSPYRESISRIWSMITTDRADVEEKLPDGTFLKLDAQNFDKDNFVSKEKKPFVKPELEETPKPTELFKNTDGKNQDETNKDVDTPVVEEQDNSEQSSDNTEQKKADSRYNNKKNKGKNRNTQNNNQSVQVDVEPVE